MPATPLSGSASASRTRSDWRHARLRLLLRWAQLVRLLSVATLSFMSLPRLLILILTLLAQAWPVTVMRAAEVKTKCPMSCCAGDGAAACGCATAPDAPHRSVPANVPPTAGRDLLPLPALVSELEVHLPKSMVGTDGSAARMALADCHEGRAQRRLTVLHCSFLI